MSPLIGEYLLEVNARISTVVYQPDLNMSWLLAGSTVGVGYQLQSARGTTLADTVSVSRFLPGSEQAMHSFTLGLTRKWGAAAPPPLVELPLLLPDLDVAATETTPTPAL